MAEWCFSWSFLCFYSKAYIKIYQGEDLPHPKSMLQVSSSLTSYVISFDPGSWPTYNRKSLLRRECCCPFPQGWARFIFSSVTAFQFSCLYSRWSSENRTASHGAWSSSQTYREDTFIISRYNVPSYLRQITVLLSVVYLSKPCPDVCLLFTKQAFYFQHFAFFKMSFC